MSLQLALVVGTVGTLGSLVGAFSGAFTESREMVAAITGAVLGTAVAASVTIFYETMRERKNRSLDLIDEYNSPEFLTIRNEAGTVFRKNIKSNLKMGWNELHEKIESEEWRSISKVIHYYKKLNFLTELGEVNIIYLSSFFSCEFWHWYNEYFKAIDGYSNENEKEANFESLFKYIKKPDC
jgi:hypothetical protein